MTNAKKNFIWNIIGSTLNAFTSLFFLIIATRINGKSIAGIFTFAFSFATLVQVIGNYAGRSYHVTEPDKKISDNDFLYSKIITCTTMLLFSLIFIFIKGYSIYKITVLILLILFRMVEVISEVFYAIVQKKSNLYLNLLLKK